MVSTVGQVYPAFVSAFISSASSISVLYESSESSLVHLVTSSTLLCQLSIHQLLRVDFSSEYEYHHTCQCSKAIILIPWNYIFMIVDFVSSYHLFLIHDCCAVGFIHSKQVSYLLVYAFHPNIKLIQKFSRFCVNCTVLSYYYRNNSQRIAILILHLCVMILFDSKISFSIKCDTYIEVHFFSINCDFNIWFLIIQCSVIISWCYLNRVVLFPQLFLQIIGKHIMHLNVYFIYDLTRLFVFCYFSQIYVNNPSQ
ncbi:Hypothetical_protein [Hexamita inflata]|uniref:Hypothetical_protein n=1 Tax=Hexamita inflata TaxID=28002 RepID=A0AA86PVK0_9EUKA|nr:Hypothetical protein HINF_LOCUS34699 [Hexamita inflata]